ncbi:MAG: hypothetical protein J7L78_00595 [Dehalococcoidales bacterium]|nr:hypothetical protein [Dehalococcoidales bacterium]
MSKGSVKGLRPFKNNLSPSPLKERGIQGVRLVKRKLRTRVSNTFLPIAAGLVGAAIVINISALDAYNDWLYPLAFFLVFGICFYIWVIRG